MPTRMICALTLICLALPLALAAVPAAAQTVVEGKNDPAVDVRAVQAAVDQGGKVVLRRA
jgi:apolipoprotein N-acyltransferase